MSGSSYPGGFFLNRRIWTFDEVMEVFPQVKKITEEMYSYVSDLTSSLTEILPENVQEEKEEEILHSIHRWTSSLRAMGIEVKGLWLVDFDKGDGYYCWKYGEETVKFEHSYESGFAGRKKIKAKENTNGSCE